MENNFLRMNETRRTSLCQSSASRVQSGETQALSPEIMAGALDALDVVKRKSILPAE
jgi:hypothetical protein